MMALLSVASLRRWLHFVPDIIVLALIAALLLSRAELAKVRSADRLAIAGRHLADARARLADSERVARAVTTYAAHHSALQPIILRSIETVNRYAQTPAGRIPCLDADRLRGLDELDAAIRAAGSPGDRDGTLQSNTGAPSAERGGDGR